MMDQVNLQNSLTFIIYFDILINVLTDALSLFRDIYEKLKTLFSISPSSTHPLHRVNDVNGALGVSYLNTSSQFRLLSEYFFAADPRNQNDNMYTTILASRSQEELASRLVNLLQRTKEVIVEPKDTVVRKNGNQRACAEATVKYITERHVTGIVVLSSEELDRFLSGAGGVKLQITGEDVELDYQYIANAFMKDQTVRSKLLLVVPRRGTRSQINSLQNVDLVELGEDQTTWGKDIVARFMQKNHMKR